jgi:hypothetical protein
MDTRCWNGEWFAANLLMEALTHATKAMTETVSVLQSLRGEVAAVRKDQADLPVGHGTHCRAAGPTTVVDQQAEGQARRAPGEGGKVNFSTPLWARTRMAAGRNTLGIQDQAGRREP